MSQEYKGPSRILSTVINSFHYLYQDAEYLGGAVKSLENGESFQRTRLSRTAVLLYILSLEGLINRAMDEFLLSAHREFFLDREAKFPLLDKWLLLPLLLSGGSNAGFQTDRYPWSHFAELVKLRNDFVHPKHNRKGYLRQITPRTLEPLKTGDIPPDSGLTKKDLPYPQTQIPRDPYAIMFEHVAIVKKIVDDIIAELDRLLEGRITKDNWLHSDQMKLIYPLGATLQDVP